MAVALLKAPTAVNADLMRVEEIHIKLKDGYDEIKIDKVQEGDAAFVKFCESH
ncbi:hypothetical protein ACSZOP_02725 [Colibacter massiliensis]|uniref:hypothetical protein n=1 Tax=Colibacter massiliensis TaxID=1852379 RepID=UPI003F93EB69